MISNSGRFRDHFTYHCVHRYFPGSVYNKPNKENQINKFFQAQEICYAINVRSFCRQNSYNHNNTQRNGNQPRQESNKYKTSSYKFYCGHKMGLKLWVWDSKFCEETYNFFNILKFAQTS